MRVCYFNLTSKLLPRDRVYLKGLAENGVEIIECTDSTPGIAKFARLYRKHKNIQGRYDLMFVGYSGHILVPFARLISRKKIIFNALSSLYEGIIISRTQSSPLSFRGISCWFIDFLAFHSAHKTLLESNGQIEYVAKKFLVPRHKLIRTWTGVDDSEFYNNPDIKKLPVFTVLFRGSFMPESGIEHVIEAARILRKEPIKFRIIGNGLLASMVTKKMKEFDSSNIEWIKDKIPMAELRQKIQECHLSLGQLSDHERLARTIPHKAFESIVMNVPYLTARNKAIVELLIEGNSCICCRPADSQDVAGKILEMKKDPELLRQIAENGRILYNQELTPKILAKNLLANMRKYL